MNASSLELLEKVQLPAAQARAILQAVDLEFASRDTDLATKADLHDLDLAVKADLRELALAMKADLRELALATKAGFRELAAKVAAEM